jgi:hypothetical protein
VGGGTEPWGTPSSISLGIEISASTETLNLPSDRNDLRSLITQVENVYRKPVCHVVSKAFAISKNTAAVDILLLK